ncbi:prostasin [Amia ocellicauda]|uniref:prostasin n=1 Tax=Amia ocellicauda TaxID=2972642 RepID=UPI003464798A
MLLMQLMLFVFLLNTFKVSSSPLSRSTIRGGQDAKAGEWPWQVYVYVGTDVPEGKECGGSLISASWVLTAAHCLEPTFIQNTSYVRLGAYQLDRPSHHEIKSSIVQKIVHKSYMWARGGFDIGLVELKDPVPISSYIHPVHLAQMDNYNSKDCWATGWGETITNVPLKSPRTLQEVQLPIIDNKLCQDMYNNHHNMNTYYTIKPEMLCAGYERGLKDTCQGDSGGPLVCKKGRGWVQAGIVSFGKPCGSVRFPGVYTRVTSYRDWIKKHSGI